MLTPGNRKLGKHLIWGFGLPSGTARVCRGMTPACRRHCYAVRLEGYRPAAAARYRVNLALSRAKGFARRVRAFLVAHRVRVVRVHTGGEFYSAGYACKWLAVMARSRRVRFYLYSRAWRVPAIKAVLDAMAARPNCRVWYSCDRDTGVPAAVPPAVRLAWLMVGEGDRPPAACHLVFRVRRLRKNPNPAAGGVPVCPAEVGGGAATCDGCGVCWRPLAGGPHRRIPLPLLPPIGTVPHDDPLSDARARVPVGPAAVYPGRRGSRNPVTGSGEVPG
jgi:hypothetical protein